MSTREEIEAGAPVALFGRTYTWARRAGRWTLVAEPAELAAARAGLVAELEALGAPEPPAPHWTPWWTAAQLDLLRRHLVLPRLESLRRLGLRTGGAL